MSKCNKISLAVSWQPEMQQNKQSMVLCAVHGLLACSFLFQDWYNTWLCLDQNLMPIIHVSHSVLCYVHYFLATSSNKSAHLQVIFQTLLYFYFSEGATYAWLGIYTFISQLFCIPKFFFDCSLFFCIIFLRFSTTKWWECFSTVPYLHAQLGQIVSQAWPWDYIVTKGNDYSKWFLWYQLFSG